MTRSDLSTVFPVAALIGFAAWVVLLASTGDPGWVFLFVAAFLVATWRLCGAYYDAIAEREEQQELQELQDWWSE